MIGYATDAEGPIVLNDNAAELYNSFVGPGYPVISKWVVYRFSIENDEDYKAGDTLRVILPFLRAYGVTNQKMQEYAERTIQFVPGAEGTLQNITGNGTHASIVSTSFEQYVSVLCERSGFPFRDAYCTRLNIDECELTGEQSLLIEYAREIAAMDIPVWRDGTTSLDEIDEPHRKNLTRLNTIIADVRSMRMGSIIDRVDPVGGPGKAESLELFSERAGIGLDDILYHGDSITDVDAFKLLRKQGGLTVSFNGNRAAIQEAEIATISPDTTPSVVLAYAFDRGGKSRVLEIARDWHSIVQDNALGDFGISDALATPLYDTYSREIDVPHVEVIGDDREHVIAWSEEYRKGVRGDVGSLV